MYKICLVKIDFNFIFLVLLYNHFFCISFANITMLFRTTFLKTVMVYLFLFLIPMIYVFSRAQRDSINPLIPRSL